MQAGPRSVARNGASYRQLLHSSEDAIVAAPEHCGHQVLADVDAV